MCFHTQQVCSALHRSSGATRSLVSSPRKHSLGGPGGSRSSARPGIVREGTGQAEAGALCPVGGLGRSRLCWASSPRSWCTARARDPTCCLEGSFCPHVCHLLPTPCAPRRQHACQPWSLCVPSVQPGAQHALGVQSVSSVGTASVCTFLSRLYTAGGGSTGAARAARCPLWDLLSQPGPGLCGR